MSKHKYDAKKVVSKLLNKGLNIDWSTNTILVPTDGVIIVGIHSWGKIDFLVNYCNYRYHIVSPSEAQQQRAAERAAKAEERKAARNNKRNNK